MRTKYAVVIHLKTNQDILSSLLFDTKEEARAWADDRDGARGVYGFSVIRIHVR